MLVALNYAFDSIDNLLFLHKLTNDNLRLSGDGVLKFSNLIAAGLAYFSLRLYQSPAVYLYSVGLTQKGQNLVDAWIKGERTAVEEALKVV